MVCHVVVVLTRGCEVFFIILWFCPSMLSPSPSMVSTGCQLACEKPLSCVLQAWLHPSWCFAGLGQWDIYIVYYILKVNEMLYFVSVLDFLPCMTCSVLSCCVVLWRQAKLEAECTSDHRSSDGVETQYSHSWWKQKHWIELNRTETYELSRCSGAETHQTRIWRNLGVTLNFKVLLLYLFRD